MTTEDKLAEEILMKICNDYTTYQLHLKSMMGHITMLKAIQAMQQYHEAKIKQVFDKTIHNGTIPQSDEWFKEIINEYLKQQNNDNRR